MWLSKALLKVSTIRSCRSIADTDNISEVAHKEVNAHQVTDPAVVGLASKPHSKRMASRALKRQGAVSDLNLLASVASAARGPTSNETSYVLIFNCLMPDAVTDRVDSVLVKPHPECSQYLE